MLRILYMLRKFKINTIGKDCYCYNRGWLWEKIKNLYIGFKLRFCHRLLWIFRNVIRPESVGISQEKTEAHAYIVGRRRTHSIRFFQKT